ncbi:esterase family protein [Flavobacterium sp. KDG-16]|uniref:Esterase family protein n=2 Tax=Flavobacterium difficile TaxID=2709659 RepID=A0ABX0IC22_9FLAO|nr:esterase family protein [Flavobacterium difficile]
MKFWCFILLSCMGFSQENIQMIDLKNSDDFIGQIKRIESFPSQHIEARTVDVWLPTNYTTTKKYQVLYMHDGQMLFDAKTTWNKQEWGVDEKIDSLVQKKAMKEVIVVAIWNIPTQRHLNYFPQKALDFLSDSDKKTVLEEAKKNTIDYTQISSDNYLKFIVTELKPFVDSHFSVYTDYKNTAIMGSSMGGLISMYALCEYPTVFGKAACLSTHWIGLKNMENNPIPNAFFAYLQQKLPSPKTHKIYFDFGTATLDAAYVRYENEVNVILKAKGFDASNSKNLKFENADHTENSWNKRLEIPLQFLFK